jgi:hypothetical protein
MSISTFGQDANGELYVADIDGGALYQVVDPNPQTKRRAAQH